VKILTDIDIYQSPEWAQETELTENLYPGWIRNLKKRLSGPPEKFKHLFDIWVIIENLFRYDAIITGNIKTAQILGFVRVVLGLKSPKHVVLELMLDEQQESLKWKFKRAIQRRLFSAVDLIFVSSKSEITTYEERLRLPSDRFRFIPFHTDVVNPGRISEHSGYIFSAGKTGRDFDTLLRAVEGMNVKVVIVSDQYHAQHLKVPNNVSLMVDIPYEDYLRLLRECYFVVVPLCSLVKSTGQVVILEAMGLGKPVIATDTVGTIDYIQHGVNGLMVPVGDAAALRVAIDTPMADHQLYDRLATNGLDTVCKYHTFDAYVKAILQETKMLQIHTN
jgi:glycosyltransferase involved in cell wall biosynthesis